MWFRPQSRGNGALKNPTRGRMAADRAPIETRTSLSLILNRAFWAPFIKASLTFLIASCDPAGPKDAVILRLEPSPGLSNYARLVITVGDTLGNRQDTVFNDTLTSPSRLYHLALNRYAGDTTNIVIMGFQAGIMVYREVRVYDGRSQKVIAMNVAHYDAQNPFTPKVDPTITSKSVPTPAPDSANIPLPSPPILIAHPSDTSVSIRDTIVMDAETSDIDGDLAGFSWTCNGATVDSGFLSGARETIRYRHAFSDPGDYSCQIKVWDRVGRKTTASFLAQVFFDPPTADAGADTTVTAGTLIRLHAKGEDGLGPVVSRAWQCGEEPFVFAKQQESTMQAPNTPGELQCILRITDSDSLSTFDTLRVTITASATDSLAVLSNRP